MMTENQTEPTDTETSEEQAIDTDEANDTDHIHSQLPEDIHQNLTKRAFSAGSMRKLLRDTYYFGPIRIGTGGWRGVFGGGQAGTGMRRPSGALYNFPRSWRYAALERALNLGLITHVGGRSFAATERGVAILRRVDTCPECGEQRIPGIRSTVYIGDPNSEGSLESHSLVTYCPDCGGKGYGQPGDSVQSSVSEFERDEEQVETASQMIQDHPDARVYGVDRPISPDASNQSPDVNPDATADLLDEVVEEQAPPTVRELLQPEDEGLYGRQFVTIPREGAHYRFTGTEEAISISRTDSEGDIHVTLDSDDRLKIGMDYHTAVELNVKDVLHHDAEDAEWTGDYWTIAADALPRAVCKLTLAFSEEKHRGAAWYPDDDSDRPEDSEFLTVTVSEDAMSAVNVPMFGVDPDGNLI